MKNRIIRNDISSYVKANGPTNSRKLIAIMAARHGVPKQQISGNLSFMICRAGTLNLVSQRPNSFVY